MKRPRLTAERLRGLGEIADFFEERPTTEMFSPEIAKEVEAALVWVREQQLVRRGLYTGDKP